MKHPLLLTLAVSIPALGHAQTLIDSGQFFDPDFSVRRFGATSGTLALTVTNLPTSGSASSGNVSWTNSAGGHAQVRSQLSLGIIPLANLDAQLAGYTRIAQDSLIFGREITTDAEILGAIDVGPALQGLIGDVAGASVLYNWQAGATVSGLSIAPDQLYQVNFTVTSGNGLPVDLLQAAAFGITTVGISGANNESATSLNLLNLITLGTDPSVGNFSFNFRSDTDLSALDFSFAAASVADVSLLGGTGPNQNVLTFSGFQVQAIPEPGTTGLLMTFLGLTLLRRKRD
ncbi:MAG: PEP-CTERM sorting domain-containing protein [Verrucomicrobiota bacterium]